MFIESFLRMIINIHRNLNMNIRVNIHMNIKKWPHGGSSQSFALALSSVKAAPELPPRYPQSESSKMSLVV